MDGIDNEPEAVAAALAASSAAQMKWASFVLLGPLVPSLLAIANIVIGGAVVKVSPRGKLCTRLTHHDLLPYLGRLLIDPLGCRYETLCRIGTSHYTWCTVLLYHCSTDPTHESSGIYTQ